MISGPGKFYAETKFQVQAITNTVIPVIIKFSPLSSQKPRIYLGRDSGRIFGGIGKEVDRGIPRWGET